MPKTPEQIKHATELIAESIFRRINPDDAYIVINSQGSAFTTRRLLAGLPSCFVTSPPGPPVPIRDFGIYRTMGIPERDNDIPNGWADALIEEGIAEPKLGADITVLDILACAKMEVFLRLQAEAEA